MAFVSLEGLPDVRADFGFGQVCATLANIHRRDGQDAFGAGDFMPGLKESSPSSASPSSASPSSASPSSASPSSASPSKAQTQAALLDPEAHSRLIAALLGKK
jgi:hypothetical protein